MIAAPHDTHTRDPEEEEPIRNELDHTKVEQEKPVMYPNTNKSRDISFGKDPNFDRHKNKKGRRARNYKVPIAREEKCKYSLNNLPTDTIPKGYHRVIIQDIKITPDDVVFLDNVKLVLEVFYSPSTKNTYMAERPIGCEGEYGAGVRTKILSLMYMENMSVTSIQSLFTSYGILISKGSVSRISRRDAALFHGEADDILRAGVLAFEYVHIDDTGVLVNGRQHFTQTLCNPFFTAYVTLPHKDRLSIVRMLLMGKELEFQFNDATFELLEIFKVPEKVREYLKEKCAGQTLTEQELEIILKEIPSDNRNPDQLYRRIMEAAGITWYHEQKEVPVIQTLISDDADQFRYIAERYALCWVHAGCLIKKLNPQTPLFQEEVNRILYDFWNYYRTLQAFQLEPEQCDIEDLRAQFDKIFTRRTGFPALNKVLQTIFDNKENLLVVLKFPQIPLNHNSAELGARTAVRKRDVSLHTMTPDGTKAFDTVMTIISTAKKLGVDPREYIHDRITHNDRESLAVTLLKRVGFPI